MRHAAAATLALLGAAAVDAHGSLTIPQVRNR
jgi:hypothetical protein